MALPQAQSRVPTSIGQMYYEMVDEDGTIQLRQIRARVEVKDGNGEPMGGESWSGSLVPFMTQAEIDWLNVFLDKYRTLANTEIIP